MPLSQEDQTLIREHVLSPPYKESLGEKEGVYVHNPSCGDQVRVRAQGSESGLQWTFDGEGCSISMASASIMTTLLQGKSRSQSEEIIRLVLGVFRGERDWKQLENIGEMRVFEDVLKKPVRTKCVLLPWRAAALALKE